MNSIWYIQQFFHVYRSVYVQITVILYWYMFIIDKDRIKSSRDVGGM